jgi:hypothetical protein
VTEPVRADNEIPDIVLQPSANAKHDANSTRPKASAPTKTNKKEAKTLYEVIPDIVLQRPSTRPGKSAAKEPHIAERLQRSNLTARTNEAPALAAMQPDVVKQASAVVDDSQPSQVQLASPVDVAAYTRFRAQSAPRQANYQTEQLKRGAGATVGLPSSASSREHLAVRAPENSQLISQPNDTAARVSQLRTAGQASSGTQEAETLPPPDNQTAHQDPCAGVAGRPYNEFDINIAMPAGEAPTDIAARCWVSLNSAAGPFAGQRSFAQSIYAWDATSLCYRPLYFEEANLERYGYGCCETLQPLASAAHFFGTIPILPYCMAVDCPNECIYTLGQYRPGSCVPKRYIWPPVSPRAALAEGGVWTGMVFLIP